MKISAKLEGWIYLEVYTHSFRLTLPLRSCLLVSSSSVNTESFFLDLVNKKFLFVFFDLIIHLSQVPNSVSLNFLLKIRYKTFYGEF